MSQPYFRNVNLRTQTPRHLVFATHEGMMAYENSVVDARRSQKCRYAVAPKVTLVTPYGGRTLDAGAEVKLQDFEGATFGTVNAAGDPVRVLLTAQQALADAVRDGLVLEAEHVVDRDDAGP